MFFFCWLNCSRCPVALGIIGVILPLRFVSSWRRRSHSLRDLVAQLLAENQQMRQEQEPNQPGSSTASFSLSAPGLSSTSGHSSAPALVTDRLIFLPRDRKCPMFLGRTGLSIREWIEEVQACIQARHSQQLSPADQALFIYHLEGEGRIFCRVKGRARQGPVHIKGTVWVYQMICLCRKTSSPGNNTKVEFCKSSLMH